MALSVECAPLDGRVFRYRALGCWIGVGQRRCRPPKWSHWLPGYCQPIHPYRSQWQPSSRDRSHDAFLAGGHGSRVYRDVQIKIMRQYSKSDLIACGVSLAMITALGIWMVVDPPHPPPPSASIYMMPSYSRLIKDNRDCLAAGTSFLSLDLCYAEVKVRCLKSLDTSKTLDSCDDDVDQGPNENDRPWP
jgi:hypothetical protein